MPDPSRTLIDYLRHGQPEGGQCYRGSGVDDALSERGWQQMQAAAAAVDGWQRVISSPLQRCRAFAESLADERGLPLSVVDDLREVGFGSWEGVTREQLKRERAAEYRAFYDDPVNNRPAGAEPLEALAARVGKVFDGLARQYAGEHVLVVAHAGVIRATLGHVTRMPPVNWYRVQVDNAALSRFRVDGARAQLIVHNWRSSL
ncbi:MAG: histidine phosphatase family protein [Gammaproteobacteria bacterium]|nr:histidine phosphatase family protein [Gammaproteobacteria bacterium]